MSKPTLYYALVSPPSRACILTTKLICLDVNLKVVDLAKKENLSKEFIKLNPTHQIPVLVDEKQPYGDSHAIMAYMVSKYAKNDCLYPKDLSKRARVDQRLHFETGVVFQVFRDFVKRIIYGTETEFNPKTIENCHTAYEFLEKFLENQCYVAGNDLTIGDVSINTTLITLHRLIPVEKEKYPNIFGWLERMKCLPCNAEINEKGADQVVALLCSRLAENRSKAKC